MARFDIPGINYRWSSPWGLAKEDPGRPRRLARAQTQLARASTASIEAHAANRIAIMGQQLEVSRQQMLADNRTSQAKMNFAIDVFNFAAGEIKRYGIAESATAADNYTIGLEALQRDIANRPAYEIDPDNPEWPDGRPRYRSTHPELAREYQEREQELREAAEDSVRTALGKERLAAYVKGREAFAAKFIDNLVKNRNREQAAYELGLSVERAVGRGEFALGKELLRDGVTAGTVEIGPAMKAHNEIERKETEFGYRSQWENFQVGPEFNVQRETILDDPKLTAQQKKALIKDADDLLHERYVTIFDTTYTQALEQGYSHAQAMKKATVAYATVAGKTARSLGFSDFGGKERLMTDMSQQINRYNTLFEVDKTSIRKGRHFQAFSQGVRVYQGVDSSSSDADDWFAERERLANEAGEPYNRVPDIMFFARTQDWLPPEQTRVLVQSMRASDNPQERILAADIINRLREDPETVEAYHSMKLSNQDKMLAYMIADDLRYIRDPDQLAKRLTKIDEARTIDPVKQEHYRDSFKSNYSPDADTHLQGAIEADPTMGAGGVLGFWQNYPEEVKGLAKMDFLMSAERYAQYSDNAEAITKEAYRDWRRKWSPTTMYGNSTPELEKNGPTGILAYGHDAPWLKEAWAEFATDNNIDPSTHRVRPVGPVYYGEDKHKNRWMVVDETGSVVINENQQALVFSPRKEDTKTGQRVQKQRAKESELNDYELASSYLRHIHEKLGARSDSDIVNKDYTDTVNPRLRQPKVTGDLMVDQMNKIMGAISLGDMSQLNMSRNEVAEVRTRYTLGQLDRLYQGKEHWTPEKRSQVQALFFRYYIREYDKMQQNVNP